MGGGEIKRSRVVVAAPALDASEVLASPDYGKRTASHSP
jgi:hypothetical protein